MNYLFVTMNGGGNLPPQLALAGRLRARGHVVRFLGHASQRRAVEQAGFPFRAFARAPDYDPADPASDPVRDWSGDPAAQIVERMLTQLIFGPADALAADVLDELERCPTDAVAVDFFLLGGLAAAERAGVATAVLWHTVYAPGTWWNGGLESFNRTRARLGLSPLASVFDQYDRAQYVLILTSRRFDFALAEAALPANAHHVGPQLAAPVGRSARGRPMVLVSLSTTYQRQEDILQRIIDALGSLPVDAVVSTGLAVKPPSSSATNVEIREWVSFPDTLPSAGVVVTHAGHGTVISALAHGIPLVCVPMGRGQHGNAARAQALGASSAPTLDASRAHIADAIQHALTDDSLRAGAARAAEIIATDLAADRATALLEAITQPTTTGDGHADHSTHAAHHA